VVIRHSKAVSGEMPDADRPLAEGGLRDASAGGRWLAEHRIVPDLAVVSPALRTCQSWEVVRDQLGDQGAGCRVVTDGRVYENSLDSVLAALRTAADSTCVAVVGHNPSLHSVVVTLDADAVSTWPSLESSYPTSAIAVFDVACSWSDLRPGAGTLRDYVAPRG
jgi:phosphohistidine phosphatase